MTINDALTWAIQAIGRTNAQYVLLELLEQKAAWLVLHKDEALEPALARKFEKIVKLAANDVPIPYLLGYAWFYGRKFRVSPDVLIPRPETEELVQHGLSRLARKKGQRIVDVGTGSGIIAITLALETAGSDHSILATDLSVEALKVAYTNAKGLKAKITFKRANLLAQHPGPFDLIIANLPYISENEKDVMGAGVLKHEPRMALFSPNDGFSHIETLLSQARNRLTPQGAILLEIGYKQGEKGLALCKQYFPQAKCSLLKDMGGLDRILTIVQRRDQRNN